MWIRNSYICNSSYARLISQRFIKQTPGNYNERKSFLIPKAYVCNVPNIRRDKCANDQLSLIKNDVINFDETVTDLIQCRDTLFLLRFEFDVAPVCV